MARFLLYEQSESRRSLRRQRLFRDRMNPLEHNSDEELYERFRFSRNGVEFILNAISDDLKHSTRRNYYLTPVQQLCIALQYFATGNFMLTAGELIGSPPPVSANICDSFTLLTLQFIRYK